jgi:hypothetical protein
MYRLAVTVHNAYLPCFGGAFSFVPLLRLVGTALALCACGRSKRGRAVGAMRPLLEGGVSVKPGYFMRILRIHSDEYHNQKY